MTYANPEIVERLRAPTNWLRQGTGDWKSVVNEYDRTPYEAADLIEAMAEALSLASKYVVIEGGTEEYTQVMVAFAKARGEA